jgi:hypothetical protein
MDALLQVVIVSLAFAAVIFLIGRSTYFGLLLVALVLLAVDHFEVLG